MTTDQIWAVFPIKTLISVQEKPCDIYVIVDTASTQIFGFVAFTEELPSTKEVKSAFKKARKAAGGWPGRILLQKEDPCEQLFVSIANNHKIKYEIVPTTEFDAIKKPVQESFEDFQSGGRSSNPPDPNLESIEQARAGIPESYDLCSCGSGKKYKFCCKPIFQEIVEAMCAFEDGHFTEALKWLEAAKKKVGETAEIVCREVIIYSVKSREEFSGRLREALKRFPKHPRLHYLLAIEHKEAGRFDEAATAYLAAIERYPSTDKYHLNEAWNNLGGVYHLLRNFSQAKGAWEKALMYMPMDVTCKNNLTEFVYQNPELDDDLREPSPFVARYLRG